MMFTFLLGFFLFMIFSVLLITWKYYDIIEKIVLYEIWDTALNYERHQTQWFEEARNRGLSQHFLWQAHQIRNVHSLDLIIDQAYAPKKKKEIDMTILVHLLLDLFS